MLTEAEKSSLRKYLGWPGRFHSEHPELDQAFMAVTPEDEQEVRAELDLLINPTTGIEARIQAALDYLSASAVNTIIINPMEIPALRSQARRSVARIAALLHVTVLQDAFGVGTRSNRLRFG